MLTVPTAATLGITATSYVHHPKKICMQGIIMFEEIAKAKASKGPRKKLEGVLQMAAKMASLKCVISQNQLANLSSSMLTKSINASCIIAMGMLTTS